MNLEIFKVLPSQELIFFEQIFIFQLNEMVAFTKFPSV